MTEDTDLDRLFTRLSDEGRRRPAPDDHPAPEKLSAYLANELSPEEDDALQEHLTDCTLCADLLLDLQRFLDPPEEDRPREGVGDFETAAEWRELRGKLGVREEKDRQVSRRASFSGFFASVRGAYAVAAMLALLAGGVLYLAGFQQGLQQPRTNSQMLYISSGSGERGWEKPERLELQGGVESLAIRVDVPEPARFPSYGIQILDSGDREIFKAAGLKKIEGSVSFLVDRKALPSGQYKVHLFGLKDRHAKLLETHYIEIRS